MPVSLIYSTWGGTDELWTRREILENNRTLKPLVTKGSTLYNGRIVPLTPYAIRGAIWYQGDFPFGFVQTRPKTT